MIFSYAPKFVNTVSSVLDFFHLRRERPTDADDILPYVKRNKAATPKVNVDEDIVEEDAQSDG